MGSSDSSIGMRSISQRRKSVRLLLLVLLGQVLPVWYEKPGPGEWSMPHVPNIRFPLEKLALAQIQRDAPFLQQRTSVGSMLHMVFHSL